MSDSTAALEARLIQVELRAKSEAERIDRLVAALDDIRETVHRHNGQITQYVGDILDHGAGVEARVTARVSQLENVVVDRLEIQEGVNNIILKALERIEAGQQEAVLGLKEHAQAIHGLRTDLSRSKESNAKLAAKVAKKQG